MESLGATASMKPARGSEIPKDTSMGELWGKREGMGAQWGQQGLLPWIRMSHSPVQDHQDDGTVGAQESRVLQLTPAALLGDSQSHTLGALRNELAVGTSRVRVWYLG